MKKALAALRFLAERNLTVDARTLGAFRIAFGLLCLANLYDRLSNGGFIAFYTNEGILTNHFTIFAPPGGHLWSLLFAFSQPFEVGVFLGLTAVVYVLYTVGWKTPIMKVLVAASVISLGNRVLFIQIGGNVVMNIIAVWTMFMPLGARFSVDSLMSTLARRRERTPADLRARTFATLLPVSFRLWPFFLISLNFAVIYFFNTVHKGGITWREGSAVHYVLWQNRIATTLAGLVRAHEPFWFSPALSWGTLVVEGALPLLILSPWLQRFTRPLTIFFIVTLHGSIAALCTLGPFSYSMMCFSLLLTTQGMWAWLERRAANPARRCVVAYPEDNPAAHQALRVLVRLDGLRRLEPLGRGETELLPAPIDAALAGETFVVYDPGAKTWRGGAAARRAIARALPLAPLAGLLVRPALAWVARRGDKIAASWRLDRERPEEPAEPTPARLWLARRGRWAQDIACAFILTAVVSQVLMENWAVPHAIKPTARPAWMTGIIEYLRIPQGWSMFAADAPREDAALVVDAELADGSRVDPLTGRSPDFDAPFHGPWGTDQQWCEMESRVRNAKHLWRAFRDYLARTDTREGWPEERRIVRFDVYEILSASPPVGETAPTNLRKKLLFASDQQL